MRIVSVVGTRPQLIKAAALQPVLRQHHEEVFVDTGQHWDEELAGRFFSELSLERPDHSLGAGGGSHAAQTAAMLRGLEPILLADRPEVVLVYGDTNSTLAGALAAAKLDIPVAHVEAGLRSFDRRMPEEINRVVADHLAAWLFAPTPTAVANLAAEGLRDGVVEVGDLMQDLAARVLPAIRDPAVLSAVVWPEPGGGLPGGPRHVEPGRYLFATVHRQENREPEAIARWSALLRDVARRDRRVVLAAHPGTRHVMARQRVELGPDVDVIEPQGYRTSLALQLHAAAVITDSGGVQREAAWLGVPCLVLRDRTEWREAIERSSGRMVTIGLSIEAAREALARLARPGAAEEAARRRAAEATIAPAGAAEAIARALGAGPPAARMR